MKDVVKYKKVIRYVYQALILVIIFLPAYMPSSLTHQFNSGLALPNLLLVTFLLLFFPIWAAEISEKRAIHITLLDLTVLMLFSYVALTGAVWIDMSYYTYNDKFVFFLLLFAFVSFSGGITKDDIFKTAVLCAITVNACFQSILGILQWSNHLNFGNKHFSIGGTFDNPAIFGNYLALSLVAVVALLLLGSKLLLPRIGLIISLILILIALILSTSRSAILGGVTALTVPFFLNRRFGNLNFRKKIFAASLFILFFTGVSFIYLFQIKKDSTAGRLFIIERIADMLKKEPITGFGLSSFGREYNLEQANYFRQGKGTVQERLLADNINVALGDYFLVWVENGIVGFSLFLFSLVILLKYGIASISASDRPVPASVAGTAGVITCSVLSVFSYPLQTSVAVLLISAFLLLVNSPSPVIVKYRFPLWGRRIFIFLTTGFLIYFSIVEYSHFYYRKKWKQVKNMSLFFEDEEKWDTYVSLYPYFRNNYIFLSEYGMIAYFLGKHDEAIDILLKSNKYFSNYLTYLYLGVLFNKKGMFKKAEYYLTMSSNMAPNRIKPKYHLFFHYYNLRKMNEARKIKMEMNQMQIKVPSAEIDGMKEEVNKLDLDVGSVLN